MTQPRNGEKVAKFKTRLKHFMEEHGLSRMDVVRIGKMSYPTVVAWENEAMQNLDADLVLSLMRLLKIESLDDFIYIIEEDE